MKFFRITALSFFLAQPLHAQKYDFTATVVNYFNNGAVDFGLGVGSLLTGSIVFDLAAPVISNPFDLPNQRSYIQVVQAFDITGGLFSATRWGGATAAKITNDSSLGDSVTLAETMLTATGGQSPAMMYMVASFQSGIDTISDLVADNFGKLHTFASQKITLLRNGPTANDYPVMEMTANLHPSLRDVAQSGSDNCD